CSLSITNHLFEATHSAMGALPRGLLLLGVCAVLVAAVLADASPASSMVVGLAKCADCTRKNMKAEAAFAGKKDDVHASTMSFCWAILLVEYLTLHFT
uniref:Uncharacterized protein n=1 Tax=Aegilops tauschii subsp. strangulata TaxID=200361 RepID=A0A453N874_AEGTS